MTIKNNNEHGQTRYVKRYMTDTWFSRIVGSLGRSYVLRRLHSTDTWWIWIDWSGGCMKVEGHLLRCSRFWWLGLTLTVPVTTLKRKSCLKTCANRRWVISFISLSIFGLVTNEWYVDSGHTLLRVSGHARAFESDILTAESRLAWHNQDGILPGWGMPSV